MAASNNSAPELRCVLIGKSQSDKTTLSNFISRRNNASHLAMPKCTVAYGVWRRKVLTVVETSDVLSLPRDKIRHEMRKCVALCSPGPNVLLLLATSSGFNEEDRQKLKFILSFFGEDAFKYSMVIEAQNEEVPSSSITETIQDCMYRHHRIDFNKKMLSEEEYQVLLKKMEDIVILNKGGHLNCTEVSDSTPTSAASDPPVNLVLCGRFQAWKNSATTAIFGGSKFDPTNDLLKSGKIQGQVGGRLVSVVKLPALHGRPEESIQRESLQCVSQCDPEGIHAFMLVLPVGPITEEDEEELQTIQSVFSSRVNDFTMVLLTVRSNPNSPDVGKFLRENRHVNQLCRSCQGRYFVFDLQDKQQVFELLQGVDKIRAGAPKGFTKDMLAKHRSHKPASMSCTEPLKAEEECIRMVMIGKTGCGKSATGNTIFNEPCFKSTACSESVTKRCQKVTGDVDGQPVAVVDTPGLYDTALSNDQVKEELVNCISLLAPGLHVILLVIRIGRFTEEERNTVDLIRDFFGSKSKDFIIVLFTGGDNLNNQDQTIETFLQDDKAGYLNQLIAECGGRYLVFNNMDKNRGQVRDLISKVKSMIKANGNTCYTTDIFQEAEAAIQKKANRILMEKEDEMRREEEEVGRKHKNEIQAKKCALEKQKNLIEQERHEKTKLFQQKEEYIEWKQEKMKREEEETKAKETEAKREEQTLRTNWQQVIEEMDNNLKQNTADKELEGNIEAVRQDKEIWEQEREEWWEKRHREDRQRVLAEKAKLENLIKEHEQEIELYIIKRKETQVRRVEEEKVLCKLQDDLEDVVVAMRSKHEEEARKQAEKFNEFQQKYIKDFAALTERRDEEVQSLRLKQQKQNEFLIQQLSKYKDYRKDFEKMKKRQEEEMDELTSTFDPMYDEDLIVAISELQITHEKEIKDWIQVHMEKQRNKNCVIL